MNPKPRAVLSIWRNVNKVKTQSVLIAVVMQVQHQVKKIKKINKYFRLPTLCKHALSVVGSI